MAFTNAPLEIYLQIRKGKIMGHTAFSKGGANPSTGTAWATVWPEGGVLTYLSAATTLTVSSTDTNDTSAGSGLRTVKVKGLDETFAEIDEIVTLNGQTAVTTTKSYYRIQGLSGETAGATGSNEGIIRIGEGTVTAGVPATVYHHMPIGKNGSSGCFFTVPKGMCMYLVNYELSNNSSTTTGCFRMYKRKPEGLFKPTNMFTAQTHRAKDIKASRMMCAGTDFQFQSMVESGTIHTTTYIEAILADERSG